MMPAFQSRSRRLTLIPFTLTLFLVAACGDSESDSTTSTANQVDLSHATAASFVAHSSVEQLSVTEAAPGTTLELVDRHDTILQTGTADQQGTLIFRDVQPAPGYRVVAETGAGVQASAAVAVTAPDDDPPPSFYSQQQIHPGYGYLQTRDGTLLAYNAILPGPVENGPYPTVVEYSGYDPANPDQPQPSSLIASGLGYAAVGVNMRGSGCSGGAFKYFETAQTTDGYDAIEAIAAQPWVKFNTVGMVGISYPGISQLFVAQRQPPHLAAIAPLSIIADSYRGNGYPGGILNNGFSLDWTRDRQHDALPFGQAWSKKRMQAGDQICIDNQKLRGQTPDLIKLIYDNAYYDPTVADPVAPSTFVHRINVPVFLAGAWQDEQTGGYFPTMLDQFTGTDKLHFTMTNGLHADSLGPSIFPRWFEFLSFYVAHEIPHFPAEANLALQTIVQQVFGVRSVPAPMDRFNDAPSFEAALARFEAEPKVRILFENGAGKTPGAPVPSFERSFSQWPVEGIQPSIWYFAENGGLSRTAPSGDGTDSVEADSYVYDPSRSQQVTFDGGDNIWKALAMYDWPPPEAGKAVVYSTDPLADTLVMIGSGSVDLRLKSTAKDTDIQVTLTEVRSDGTEVYVQNGWLRASQRKVDPHVSTVLRPVQTHALADAADLPAGQFALARVELFPFAHVFRAGSRLRLSVEAPGASRPTWKFDALPADGTVVNTIGRSAAAPSRLVLPVVPGIDVPPSLPPCPGLRGQACRMAEEFVNTAG